MAITLDRHASCPLLCSNRTPGFSRVIDCPSATLTVEIQVGLENEIAAQTVRGQSQFVQTITQLGVEVGRLKYLAIRTTSYA